MEILNKLLEKHKTFINLVNKNKKTIIYSFEDFKKDDISLPNLIKLIENDILDPKKVLSKTGNNFFMQYYFNNNTYESEKKEQFLILIDLLIKKGIDINELNKKNQPSFYKIKNYNQFIQDNLKILVEKYNFNIFFKDVEKSQHSSGLMIFRHFDSFYYKTFFPSFLEIIKPTDHQAIDNLFKRYLNLEKIKDEEIRYKCLKRMIELNVDLNKTKEFTFTVEGDDIYGNIETLNEFFLLKNNNCKLNENNFIFKFLYEDFEKNVKIVSDNFEKIYYPIKLDEDESFIDKLLKGKIRNSENKSYIEYILLKLSNDRRDFDKIFNDLKLFKEKYHFDVKNHNISLLESYIKNIDSLKALLELGFSINLNDIHKHRLDHKKIIDYGIPELVCGNHPEKFKELFYPNFLDDIFTDEHTYLEKYLNKYEYRIKDEEILNHLLLNIKHKKNFELLKNTHYDLVNSFVQKNIKNKTLRNRSVTLLKIILKSFKKDIDKNNINDFILEIFEGAILNNGISLPLIRDLLSSFEKNDIKNAIKEKVDMNKFIKFKDGTSLEFFNLLGAFGITRNNSDYFNEVKKINITLPLEDNICRKMYEDKHYDMNEIDYLSSQWGCILNKIQNNPQKICYCNKYTFKAIQDETLSIAIKELEKKYPNYNINKKDDYGFTIVDYYFFNVINCLEKYEHCFEYEYEKRENQNVKINTLDTILVYEAMDKKILKALNKNLIEIFNRNYDFDKTILVNIKKILKNIRPEIKTHVEKFIIKRDIKKDFTMELEQNKKRKVNIKQLSTI